MPEEHEQEIDCDDCERKRELEIEPFYYLEFISCEPIPGKDGRCLFKWRDNS